MPSPFYYRRVLDRLARLADVPNPPHVQVRAAIALAGELSPANPRRELIRQMLETANPYEFARHKLRDLYDQPDPSVPASERGPAPLLQEEESPEEDDDPL